MSGDYRAQRRQRPGLDRGIRVIQPKPKKVEQVRRVPLDPPRFGEARMPLLLKAAAAFIQSSDLDGCCN